MVPQLRIFFIDARFWPAKIPVAFSDAENIGLAGIGQQQIKARISSSTSDGIAV